MVRGRGTKEKRVCISQRTETKGNCFSDRNLWWFITDPHYLNCFSTLRQGLFYSSGVEHQEFGYSAAVSFRTGRDSVSVCRNVSPSQLRGRIGRAPVDPQSPHHWELGGSWKGQLGTSLVAQWLRIHLPMQGTQVQALGREDSTCHRATKPMHHNCWSPRA